MPSSDDIRRQLEELNEALAEAKATLEPIVDLKQQLEAQKFTVTNHFNEQIQALQAEKSAKINEINEALNKAMPAYTDAYSAVNKIVWDSQTLAQELEKKITEEEAEAQAKQALIDQAKAAEEKLDFWNKATLGAPWREWAKDHQMSGAARIVEDRYVILADGMGLGKTLTSIITCEMAHKGSSAASPEFPWLGFEKEVYVPDEFYELERDTNWDVVKETKVTGYIPYDKKQKMRQDGVNFKFVPAHNETQIVDSITRPVGRKVLYLCPSSLLSNVLDEFRRWAPHRNATYIGGFPKVVRNMVLENAHKLDDCVIILNYEAWRRDTALLDTLVDMKFDTVIIDEAHNAKDMKSNIYKGIEKLAIAYRPEYVIPMTGTPILNRPQELFTLLHIVNPEEFHTLNDFLFKYCETYEDSNGNPKWRFQPGGIERIVKRISRNFIRRTKDDAGIKLPPKTVTLHELQLDKETYADQARVRDQMRKFMTIVLDEQKGKALSAGAKIAMFTRLRQIETWPAGIIQRDPVTKEIKLQVDVYESQKMDYVLRYDADEAEWNGLIPEAVSDERIVVFSQFKAPLHELQRRCTAAGYKAAIMDGDASKDLRTEIRRDFDLTHTPNRAQAKWDIVLCHYKVGGVGLNFTAATQMVILDEEWNPGKREQAYDRIHRIGQDKPVTIHVVRNTPTIDNWLANIMGDKEAVVSGFEQAVEHATSTAAIKEALESGLI